ncbi:SRPBCC family protein [Nocardia suismassiliense]|uniref:SRPBCC family protein n=1 Tax=Nocardia suismassiliense TaxID=2077092 RepID=UPI000D1E863E|nr:SRPBCC family protein [Nocardia suismassiliense]
MKTFDLSAETVIDRPASTVWSLLADYTNDTAWRTGVVAMTADPPGIATPGTRTAEELRLAGRTWHNDGEVRTVDPGVRMTWRTTSGADAEGARSVRPLAPDLCLVRLELRVTPHGMQRAFGPLLAYMLRRNLSRDLATLRDLIESDGG